MSDELASLAFSLRAAVRRRQRRGVRWIRASARSSEEPAARSSAASRSPGEPAGSAAPPDAAPTRATPARKRRVPPALAAAMERAAEVREKAQACADLESLREAVAACTACDLCRTRTQTVFADGTGSAGVLFVGEAPGRNEDEQGVPFVGRAGALLTDIIEKGMGLERREVTIANVLKCRPPENRDPTAAEKVTCTPWLDRQIELLAPRVIIPLGRHAAGHVLSSEDSMGRMRGRVHRRGGRAVVPTFHPAYLLRSPGRKGECWKDIQLAMSEMGLERPSAGSAGGAAT